MTDSRGTPQLPTDSSATKGANLTLPATEADEIRDAGPKPSKLVAKLGLTQSRVTQLTAGGLVLAALLFKLALKNPGVDWQAAKTLVEMILDALVVAGIITYLGETRPFKNYLEERLRDNVGHFAAENRAFVSHDFVERATNEDTLRAIYGPDILQKIERAVQCASLQQPLDPDVNKLLQTLNDMRQGVSVWRTDYHHDLVYTPCEHDPGCYFVRSLLSLRFVNKTGAPYSLPIQALDITNASPGSENAERYSLELFEYDERDVLDRCTRTVVEEEHRTIYRATYSDVLSPTEEGALGVPFKTRSRVMYTTSEPYVMTYFLPVKGFEITLRHPSSVIPTLFVFGVGSGLDTDPLKPDIGDDPEFHRWRYDGWLLNSHGWVMTFARSAKRQSGPQVVVKERTDTRAG